MSLADGRIPIGPLGIGPNGEILVATTGTVYQQPDGTQIFSDVFGINTSVCGVGPNQLNCYLELQRELPTLDSGAPADILNVQEQVLSSLLSPEARSALSFLPYEGAPLSFSPTLAAVADVVPLVGADPAGLGGLLTVIASNPGTAEAINAEVAAGVAARYASGDPYRLETPVEILSGTSSFRIYEQGVENAVRIAADPIAQAVNAEALQNVSLLFGDGFGSAFTGISGTSGSTIFGVPTFSGIDSGSTIFGSVFGPTTGSPPIQETGGGGILDSLGGITGIADTLLRGVISGVQSGFIRGDVGEFLTPLVGGPAPSPTMTAPIVSPTTLSAPSAFGGSNVALLDTLNQILGLTAMGGFNVGDMSAGAMMTTDNPFQGTLSPTAVSPQQLLMNSALCGRRRTAVVTQMTAPGIFKLGCSGYRPYAKVIAQNPDGTRDLFVKVGQIASPSPRTLKRFAKRWAKEAGLSCGPRMSHRRTYRRRRPH